MEERDLADKPTEGFHPGIYKDRNSGIENMDPYVHYLQSGSPSGPWQTRSSKLRKTR